MVTVAQLRAALEQFPDDLEVFGTWEGISRPIYAIVQTRDPLPPTVLLEVDRPLERLGPEVERIAWLAQSGLDDDCEGEGR
jgi:hypothetical protein